MHIDCQLYYAQIEKLLSEKNRQARGYAFEQIIREILPWDFRPPIAAIGDSEQLDAFFTWQGRDFLVESKAKEALIQPGSHDWEDFELKVRKRHGQVIGIFASMFDVSPKIFEKSEQASLQGIYLVVIDKTIWSGLTEHRIPVVDYVNYVLAALKTSNKSRPKKIADVRQYFEDADRSRRTLTDALSPISGRFLRRFKKDLHEPTYVPRQIDEAITQRCAALRPSKISREKYSSSAKKQRKRKVDEQISIIRDASGAGKTTLAVQLSLNISKRYVSLCRTASDANLDGLLEDLRSLGTDYGIGHLKVTDSVVLYVVDSLDEAEHLPNARRNVISLNRCIDILNEVAHSAGLAAFPILILYTVRDEYWRAWESVFEGLSVRHHVRRFSKFSIPEASNAISKYCAAYNYCFSKKPSAFVIGQLSSPFDLSVFSETFAHEGKVDLESVFSKSVLTTFFLRKSENLSMRPIPGTPADKVIYVASVLAWAICDRGIANFEADVAFDVFREETDLDVSVYKAVLDALKSERIIELVEQSATNMRFRHNRFVEYLVALYFGKRMIQLDSEQVLTEMISCAEISPFLSVISLSDTFRSVCSDTFASHYDRVSSFFSKSVPFLMRITQKDRLGLAQGKKTEAEDLEILQKGLASGDANFAWESFFVFFAKFNRTTNKKLLGVFVQAWDLNAERSDRWRLIEKISGKQLLLDEEVLRRIFSLNDAESWLCYFDKVVQLVLFEEFVEAWTQLRGGEVLGEFEAKYPRQAWRHVRWVLDYTLAGKPYPLGEHHI